MPTEGSPRLSPRRAVARLTPPNPEAFQPDAAAIRGVCADPRRVRMVFQPIVDLERGVVCGFEALTRFLKGSPEDWFGAAARLGLVAELEGSVLRAALAAHEQLPPDCYLSINLSPYAAHEPVVRQALAAAPSLDAIVLEITEQLVVDDYAKLALALAPARDRGARIAVDDVGSENASLNQVVMLEPDFVKIDRSLVTGLDHDRRRSAVVEAIGTLASRVDALVVAEGVETEAELEALVGLGVPLGQGFAFGHAIPRLHAIDLGLGPRIRELAEERATALSVASLVERRAAVADPQQAAALPDDVDQVVQVDDGERPVAVLRRASGWQPADEAPLCVQAVATAAEAALRAIARPKAERFAPVVCCDADGRYLGVIEVERLIEALAA
jgi:EAL domain-containing protein (putative c-di-GMP-specific phosphodiesterase class I)